MTKPSINHNTWACYGWVCCCCRQSISTICGRVMVGFVVVLHKFLLKNRLRHHFDEFNLISFGILFQSLIGAKKNFDNKKSYSTIQTLGSINVQSLIFGNSLKNENENRLVFETVSKYIARTKRFD
jgi:hypothetical protein